jgi:hypothetical protein
MTLDRTLFLFRVFVAGKFHSLITREIQRLTMTLLCFDEYFFICSTNMLSKYRMNDLVYPVNGGMEDWAYAGSWDTDLVIQCNPITYNGYPKSQTKYDDSTLRVFNMLVETSNHKTPDVSELGTSLDIMTVSATGNGHVARNIRLALLAAELVQPFVVIQTVNGIKMTDDVVPSTVRDDPTTKPCKATKRMAVPHDSETATVQWIVGGALQVDESTLFYVKWNANIEAILGCEQQPDVTKLKPFLLPATMTSSITGHTKFSADNSNNQNDATIFSATIDISKFSVHDEIVVIAMARVDQNWGKASDVVSDVDVGPALGPQSHIVNARTNPDWYHSTKDGSKIIQGRIDWVSIPLTIELKKYTKATTVPAEELSLRYDESMSAEDSSSKDNLTTSALLFVGSILLVGAIGFGSRTYLQYTMRHTHRERVRDYIEDETAIPPGLQKNGISPSAYNDTTISSKRFSDSVNDVANEVEHAHGVELGTYT